MRSSETARLLGRLGVVVAAVAAVVILVLVASRPGAPAPQAAAPPAPASTSKPAPRTTSPPCSTPGGPGVVDSASGDFAGHFVNDGGPGLVENAARPRVVTGPDRRPAMEFAVPGGGKRSEVEPRVAPELEGSQRWVRYVSTLRGVPADTGTWQLLLQWHQAGLTGSPPIALEAGAGRLRLANEGSDQQDLGPLGPDDTINVVLHVVFSTDRRKGAVDVWRDGRPVLAGYHPPGGTMLDARDYLKVGIYRNPDIDRPSSLLLRRLVTGPTAASVGGTSPGPC